MGLSKRFYTIFYNAWTYRYLIVVPILLMPILGAVIGSMGPKKYTAHTSMLIQETAKMNPFLEDLAVSSMLKHRMAALETLLHSRYILGAVAKERGILSHDYTPEQLEIAVANLSSNLNIQMVGKDLIRIQYSDTDPNTMKATLESVSRHFVEQLLAPERSSIKDSSSFLEQNIDQRRKELDRAELALAEFKNKNINLLPELHVTNISRLNRLKQSLAEKKAELAGVKKSTGSLDHRLSKTNPIIGRIEEKILELRGKLTILRARYTDNHSEIQAILRKLKRLTEDRNIALTESKNILNNEKLWDIASSQIKSSDDDNQPLLISQIENLQIAKSKTEALEGEVNVLEKLVSELNDQVSKFGRSEHEFIRLQRDLEVKKELYSELLKRYEMAQVTGALSKFEESKRIKIIDLPYNPTRPTNMPLVVLILGGLVAGLLLGSGTATILALTDSTLKKREDLESLLGVPVLVRIPAPRVSCTA